MNPFWSKKQQNCYISRDLRNRSIKMRQFRHFSTFFRILRPQMSLFQAKTFKKQQNCCISRDLRNRSTKMRQFRHFSNFFPLPRLYMSSFRSKKQENFWISGTYGMERLNEQIPSLLKFFPLAPLNDVYWKQKTRFFVNFY